MHNRALCLSGLPTGAGNGTRTHDLRITNALLYQLSYTSIKIIIYHDLRIYGQKYSRLSRRSPSKFSLFLPFADSLHPPPAAVVASANALPFFSPFPKNKPPYRVVSFIGAGGVTRTRDLRITNALHYQLCYTSKMLPFNYTTF